MILSLLKACFLSFLCFPGNIGFVDKTVNLDNRGNLDFPGVYENVENKVRDNMYSNGGYSYVSFLEIGTYSFYNLFLNNLKNYQYVYDTGVSVENFILGQQVSCNIGYNTMLLLSYDNEGNSTNIGSVSNIDISLDTSLDIVDSISYSFTFYNTGSRTLSFKYIYSDINKLDCVAVCTSVNMIGNQYFKYDNNTLRSLFPDINNYLDYDMGYEEGFNNGFDKGKEIGLQSDDNNAYLRGKQVGYQEGLDYGITQGTTALTIFTGIIDIGLLPVNVFLQMFNYEVFGINIAGLVSSLVTITLIIIIIRFITGKKND